VNTEEEEDEDAGEADADAMDAPPPTLESASRALLAAAMAMQRGETTPTAAEVAACAEARKDFHVVMARFDAVSAKIHANTR
jgi:hypothetical protein